MAYPKAKVSPTTGSRLIAVPNAHVWKRQPTETPEAFAAWECYKETKDADEGGIDKVAEKLGKSRALISRWSQRWDWVDRYRAWQNYQVYLEEQEQRHAIRARTKVWVNRKVDIREDGFAIGKKLLQRAKLLLDLPVYEKVVKNSVTAASGEVIETLTVLEFQQSPRDARLLAETGLKLMRLSADMTTENLALLNENVNLDDMDDEQLDQYAEQLIALRQQQIEGS